MATREIGFIGLGAMGFGMATHLLKKQYTVRGFDLAEPILAKFREAGGKTADTPAEAVKGLAFSICMVANAQQVQGVFFDGAICTLEAIPKGATLLICSTVPPSYIRHFEKQLKDQGRADIFLVDCPVSGGVGRAAEGTLSIMASGSATALEKAKFLLQEMSIPSKLYFVRMEGGNDVGPIGMGSSMKMCHQVLAANQILATGEALGLALRMGLDLEVVGKHVVDSDAWSWMFENRLPRAIDPNFQPLVSALTIILKDTAIITKQGRLSDFPTPMCSAAEQAYLTGLSRGYGPDDDSGMIRLYTEGFRTVNDGLETGLSEETKLELVLKLLKGIYLCSTAEALSLGLHIGLDLDQLQELCDAAAGGSRVFATESGAIIKALRAGTSACGWSSKGPKEALLTDTVRDLRGVVEEAQRVKCPLFLGSQALNLGQIALRMLPVSSDVAQGSIITVWAHGKD